MKPDPKNCGRLTIVQNTYYQPPGSQPMSVESRYGRWVYNNTQPCQRVMDLTEDWVPIDTGWVASPGLLQIANLEGFGLTTIPTDVEARDIEQRVIEIGYIDIHVGDVPKKRDMFQRSQEVIVEVIPMWFIRPREDMRGEPFNLERMRIRSRNKTAKCVIYSFP